MLNSTKHNIYPAHNINMQAVASILLFISSSYTASESLGKGFLFFIVLYTIYCTFMFLFKLTLSVL